MGLKLKETSPAYQRLIDEGVRVIPARRAERQDIRPLEIGILNLMPKKRDTEIQFWRSIADTPLQINPHLLFPKLFNPSKEEMEKYVVKHYTRGVPKDLFLDALIVTGAPVETMPFEDVQYWEEFKGFLDWADTHVTSTYFSCWGAMAGLYHHYSIGKYDLPSKLSGLFWHTRIGDQDLTKGMDECFLIPHSRNTEVRVEDINAIEDLDILVHSKRAGVHLVANRSRTRIFGFGHPEYDANTLDDEHKRDVKKGINPKLPENYYPDNDPKNSPILSWRANGRVFYQNWINFVYQTTPYILRNIPRDIHDK